MPPVVHTRYGSVSGIDVNGCHEYLGIPFAAPPVGDLAFRHPVPPRSWSGVLDARHGSDNPIQPRDGDHPANQSQDCLYLNVFVPETRRQAEPLPVIVWIYGGSYSHGGSGRLNADPDTLEYDMALFARDTGTIVVTFNYRLNLYGFLNLHMLSDRFDRNCGLYDQIAALRFVHENIAAFGGDPGRVTVAGQSAGAACILALLGMPEADGLFQRCIIQSACVEHFFTEEESERNTRRFLRILGVRPERSDELLDLDPARVRRAARRYNMTTLIGGEMRCAFSPTIDGVTLRDEPKRFAQRSTMPMVIGNVQQEAERFVRGIPTVCYPLLVRLFGLHPRKGDGGYRSRVVEAASEHLYFRPLREIVERRTAPTWKYEYRYQTPSGRAAGLGCFHASELPVLFGQPSRRLTVDDPESRRVGHRMHTDWGRFAHDGDPGWAQYAHGGERIFE